jgi:hypothetical protein
LHRSRSPPIATSRNKASSPQRSKVASPSGYAERDFVYNYREALGFDDHARAARVLVGTKGKRLTYATPRSRESGEPPF